MATQIHSGFFPPDPPAFPGGIGGFALALFTLPLELFLAVSAVYGGVALTLDPSGGLVGMSTTELTGSPFGSFLLPGIILLLANGVLPLLTAMLLVLYTRAAPPWVAATGAVLLGWTVTQIAMMGYSMWIQGLFLAIGLALLAAGAGWWTLTRRS